MAQVINLKAKGLVTHPNRLGLQPGSLVRAVNVTIDKEDVVETQRGSAKYGDQLGAAAKKLFSYKDRVLVHHGTTLEYDSDGAGTWTNYSGSYSAPSGSWIQSFKANSNFYFTTSAGIKKLDSLTGTIGQAGMPKALDGQATLNSAGSGFLTDDTAVAYRVVWGIEDANENLILGAPSERILRVNSSGTDDTVLLTFTIPENITTSHFYRVYRSGLSASAATEANDELQLVAEKSPTSAEITAGEIQYTDATPDSLRGESLYTNPSQEGIGQANDLPPLAKDVAVFKRHALYVNTQTKHRFFMNLITAGSPSFHYYSTTCNISDGSPNISVIASTTGLTAGMKIEGTGIPADTTIVSIDTGAATAVMSANATATTVGVSVTFRDGVTIDGTSYWAASAYNLGNSEFASASTGNPAEDIENTAKSLVKLINRSTVNVYAFYLSGYEDLPGQLLIEDRDLGGSTWYVTGSAGDAWDPVLPSSGTSRASSNETKVNRCYIAKPDEPEAVPILQYVDVGSEDDEIVRVIALRDSAFFFKNEEGVWRMTGEGVSSFIVEDFDRSASIVGSQTAALLNNQAWCFSTQGVISVSDNGVQVWSRAIESDLLALAALSNFETVAFGVGYETERKYELWLPTTSANTYATQARVYNTFTGAWTEDIHDRTCGIVLPADDKKYMGQGDETYVRQERKSYTILDQAEDDFDVTVVSYSGTTVTLSSTADCAVGQTLAQSATTKSIITEVTDGTTLEVSIERAFAAGAAKVYNPIYVLVKYAPFHGGNPALLKHFPEANFYFRNAVFRNITVGFISNLSLVVQEVTLTPSLASAWGLFLWGEQPWGDDTPDDQPIRTYVPIEQARAHWISLQVEHTEALSNVGLEGVSIVMNEMSTRFVGG